MDYQKVYNALISKRKEFPLKKSKDLYTELHHIVPRCLGGSNESENLVRLTAREHFIAHRLLVKVYPSVIDLRFAALKMARKQGSAIINSRLFELYKAEHAEFMSKRMSSAQKKNWEGEEFREKMSAVSKKSWEDEEYACKVKEGIKRFLETNPWPWQRAKAQPTKLVWTLAATFYELYADESLVAKGKRYGCVRFSNEFCSGKYKDIFKSMVRMFKEGWIPQECPTYLEEFGDKM